MKRVLSVAAESFPIAGAFTISRGSKTEAEVLTCTIAAGSTHGRGECVPYGRYGETVAGVRAEIEAMSGAVADGITREQLLGAMKTGAARNAIDCALWDLEAKLAGKRVWQLAGLPEPKPLVTAYTLSLDKPEAMAEAARAAADRPLLKVKLGGEGDPERITAVREAAPKSRLIVDANEAWQPSQVRPFIEAMAACAVELVEQPLPAHDDGMLAEPWPALRATVSCQTARQ